jgi:hypothetical protein
VRGLRSVTQVAIGTAIGVLIGGSLVWAHGGDTALVHGCYNPSFQGPNTRIVGANEPCPAGFTAVDWSIAGPAGPAGAPGPAGPPGPPPSTPELRSSMAEIGIPRTTIRRSSSASAFTTAAQKTVTARCPASHPLVVSGGFSTVGERRGVGGQLMPVNRAAPRNRQGREGWTISIVRIYVGPAHPWRLTVYAECARTS